MVTQPAAAQRATAQSGELPADLGAWGLTGLAPGDEAAAGAEHERLHLLRLAAEHLARLGVRQGTQLGEQQRGALVARQAAEITKEVAQLGALLDLIGQPAGGQVGGQRLMLAARAEHREAAIARNRVQPGLERQPAHLAPLQVPERRGEGLLYGVLGLFRGAEHMATESQQPGRVPLEDGLERRLAAALDLRRQRVVGCEGKQPPRAERSSREPRRDGDRAHGNSVLPVAG